MKRGKREREREREKEGRKVGLYPTTLTARNHLA
jgi:hypothetical protein